MSKLEREITAVFDEAFESGKKMAPLIARWIAEELEPEDLEKRVLAYMDEHKPKTYADYIRDIEQVFREAGWKEPS